MLGPGIARRLGGLLLLATLLAGCTGPQDAPVQGASSAPEGSRPGGRSSVSPAAVGASEQAGKDGRISLTVGFESMADSVAEIAEILERRHPELEIEVVSKKQLDSGAAEDEPWTPRNLVNWVAEADVALVSSARMPWLVQYDLVRDLAATPLPEWDPLVEAYVASVTMVEGRRYALPYLIQPRVLQLRPQVFADAGLSLPPVDWILTDFETSLSDLQAAGRHSPLPIVLNHYYPGLLESTIRSFDGQLLRAEERIWALDTPEARQALSWLARVVQAGLVHTDPAASGAFQLGEEGVAVDYARTSWRIPPPWAVFQPYPRGRLSPKAWCKS